MYVFYHILNCFCYNVINFSSHIVSRRMRIASVHENIWLIKEQNSQISKDVNNCSPVWYGVVFKNTLFGFIQGGCAAKSAFQLWILALLESSFEYGCVKSSEIALPQALPCHGVYDVMCGQRGAFNEQYVLVQEVLAQSTEQERPAVMALH